MIPVHSLEEEMRNLRIFVGKGYFPHGIVFVIPCLIYHIYRLSFDSLHAVWKITVKQKCYKHRCAKQRCNALFYGVGNTLFPHFPHGGLKIIKIRHRLHIRLFIHTLYRLHYKRPDNKCRQRKIEPHDRLVWTHAHQDKGDGKYQQWCRRKDGTDNVSFIFFIHLCRPFLFLSTVYRRKL